LPTLPDGRPWCRDSPEPPREVLKAELRHLAREPLGFQEAKLHSERPLLVHARYRSPGRGQVVLQGYRGSAPYREVLEVTLPENAPGHRAIASMWARARVAAIMVLADQGQGRELAAVFPSWNAHGVMAARKFAISVPEDVMREVDQAAARRGMARSRFIASVLARVAKARTDAEIARRVDALFSDPEVAREQAETARAFRRAAPRAGTDW